LVIRAKANTTNPMVIDVDMDFGDNRWRIVIRTDDLYHVMNGSPSGTGSLTDIDFYEWNIYRFTKTDTEVNLYINENDTPIYTGAPAGATTDNSFFRFGDGWGSGNIDTNIDWVIWEPTVAGSPSELPLP